MAAEADVAKLAIAHPAQFPDGRASAHVVGQKTQQHRSTHSNPAAELRGAALTFKEGFSSPAVLHIVCTCRGT